MMLAPNGYEYYTKVICVKEIRQKDEVWGTLEVNEGDIRWALKDHEWGKYLSKEGKCHLIKNGVGLWPVDYSHFKTVDEIRDDRLNELGI